MSNQFLLLFCAYEQGSHPVFSSVSEPMCCYRLSGLLKLKTKLVSRFVVWVEILVLEPCLPSVLDSMIKLNQVLSSFLSLNELGIATN